MLINKWILFTGNKQKYRKPLPEDNLLKSNLEENTLTAQKDSYLNFNLNLIFELSFLEVQNLQEL